MTTDPPLEIRRVADGVISLVDTLAPYPNSAHSWLVDGTNGTYLINPGWTGSVDRVPNEVADLVDDAVKLGTHFHHDSIRQFGELRDRIWISDVQGAAPNCDDHGQGCEPCLVGERCAPTTWLTLQPIDAFTVARTFTDDDPVMDGGLVAVPSRGHSWTDQGYVHPRSRTLWTGDIFYIGNLFYFTHGGHLDEAIATFVSFLERDDWTQVAQPHWDFATNSDPGPEEFLVPRRAVERHYEQLLEIRAGRVEGVLRAISWWSAPAIVFPAAVGSVALRNPGHVAT
jgi:glyoxylase-like metal-dependent hydrolase (beta-lactamase superfamily II)